MAALLQVAEVTDALQREREAGRALLEENHSLRLELAAAQVGLPGRAGDAGP